ncbi:ester cyclase [Halomicroarcula limicola]|uniref:Ester cyclase n=1 Tax=Haloarcula limicola TaxID=1429915 RepID=A0A8J7Y6N4_9EURY|nr:ester cyclase [Halomicroarcula limicola]MBV0925695.1 ester cyclase [Halomicroarcula limicola]
MAATAPLAENKELARRFPEEVATAGDVELIDELCAPDVVDHSPLGEVSGREELKAQMAGIREAFEGFSATVEDVVAEGDTVAMRVALRGKHVGEFLGIEPTGKDVAIDNMVFTRIEDGRIAERWVQPDLLGLMRQVGAVDVPTA